MSNALEFITLKKLQALKAAGLVIVHSQPNESMRKAGASIGNYHYHDPGDYWHRMVAESIRLQNLEATE